MSKKKKFGKMLKRIQFRSKKKGPAKGARKRKNEGQKRRVTRRNTGYCGMNSRLVNSWRRKGYGMLPERKC